MYIKSTVLFAYLAGDIAVRGYPKSYGSLFEGSWLAWCRLCLFTVLCTILENPSSSHHRLRLLL